MTTQHIDVDSPEFEDAPKALRDAYKALQREHKTVAQERDSFRNKVQSQAVGSVLADKGFKNPKRVERDLLADGIDPLDTSAVEGWLTENGDDYAKGAQSTSAPDPQLQASAAAQQAIQTVSADAQATEALSNLAKATAEIEALGPKADGDAVKAIYAKHGV